MNFERPYEIQLFLNQLKYNAGKDCKSPKRVLEVGTAHYLGTIRHFGVLRRGMRLEKADESLIKACFFGSIEEGVYKPRE
jgi:hypothetical protein